MSEGMKKQIQKLLIDKNMDQKDLAKILNRSVTNTNMKLNGNRKWNMAEIKIMATYFDVDYNYFFANEVTK